MTAPYTNATDALNFVIALTGITGRDALLQQKLADSAGTLTDTRTIGNVSYPAGTTILRPYFVSAKALQQNRPDQMLSSADGASFTNLQTMIESLMFEQLSLDRSLNLDIPDGYAAVLDPGQVVMAILSL